jgi:Na+/H+-dicarboxylate symporter
MSDNYDFNALWHLPFVKPAWWSSDKGVIVGLIVGCIGAFCKNSLLKHIIQRGKEIAQWTLTKVFSRLIPFFILGFVARMYQTKMLNHVFIHYSVFLIWLVVFLSVYITVLFIVGSGLSLTNFLKSVKNLLPAGGIAFTSSCSLSTMPWTIEGTAKNLKNPDFASAVIPATTNIQQVGDCIANTFLCFLIYHHFYGHSPDLMTWLNFSIIFILARFATAAILGGSIFIMLPVYEKYLSFNAEMIAIILAFNVILDPIITCCNVVGNGAMCRIYERVWISLFGKKLETK